MKSTDMEQRVIDQELVMKIPKKYRGLEMGSLVGINKKIKKALGIITDSQSLTLFGRCGSGKTHLAVCLMRHWAFLNQPDHPPRYVSVPDLMAELRDTFNRDGATEHGLLQEYIGLPFLLLDDLGGGKQTEYVRDCLFRLIDARYRNESPTIVTTNLDMLQMATQIDDRIASRLCGMGEVITLGEKDWRVK